MSFTVKLQKAIDKNPWKENKIGQGKFLLKAPNENENKNVTENAISGTHFYTTASFLLQKSWKIEILKILFLFLEKTLRTR